MNRSSLFLALALPLAGCTELGPISAGICGNGVVEAGEDCDQPGGTCIAPGKSLECRYSCEKSDCQAGWMCGADKVCREPTATFRPAEIVQADFQLDLSTAEIDGKPPADLVSATFSGALSVRYGGDGLKNTSVFQSFPIRPATGNLSEGDTADDIVHVTEAALGVLLGSADQKLSPVAYAPIPVKDANARFLMLEGKLPLLPKDPKNPADFRELRFYAFDEILEITGNKIFDSFSDKPDPTIVTLPFDATMLLPLAGDIPSGDIDQRPTSPCRELVFMEMGAAEAHIYSPCKAAGYVWNDDFFALPKVTLANGAHVGFGGSVADLNGDDRLDLLLLSDEKTTVKKADGTEEDRFRVYVSFGAGDGTFNSTLPVVPGAVDQIAAPTDLLLPELPLASGDINGDKRADFVFSKAFIFSTASCLKLGPDCFDAQAREYGGFTAAHVGDLNRDGLVDIVAVSPFVRSVFFFNGTGTTVTNLFVVPTAGYPSALTVGDFDGDLVRDVAITESQGGLTGGATVGTKGGSAGGTPGTGVSGDTFSVLFGKLQGAPEPPIRMGELGSILGMAAGNLSVQGFDTMTDVGVLTNDQANQPSVAVFGGASSRQLQSPFSLSKGTSEEPDLPVAAAIGRFTGDDHADVAALTIDASKKTRLWLAPSTGAAVLSSGTTSATSLSAEIEACSATLLPADLNADGTQELLLVGTPAGLGAQGTRVVVARTTSAQGIDAWTLDAPIDFPELKATGHPLVRSACRTFILGKETDEKEGKLGHVAVADLDGTGIPEVLVMSFVVSEDEKTITSSLVVFPEGKLDAASAVPITLPEGLHPVTFALVNADKDPEPELAYFALEGVFLAELDLSQQTLTNVATLQEGFLGPSSVNYFESNPPMSMTSGDYDGDGIPDVAMAYLAHTEIFYGVPVKP